MSLTAAVLKLVGEVAWKKLKQAFTTELSALEVAIRDTCHQFEEYEGLGETLASWLLTEEARHATASVFAGVMPYKLDIPLLARSFVSEVGENSFYSPGEAFTKPQEIVGCFFRCFRRATLRGDSAIEALSNQFDSNNLQVISMLQALTPNVEGELQQARELIREAKYEASEHLLLGLKLKPNLSESQRFAVLTNLGVVNLALRRFDVACRYLESAALATSNGERSLENRVLAKHIQGDIEGSLRLALEGVKTYPESAKLWRSIVYFDFSRSLETIRAEIPAQVLASKDAEVLAALGYRALAEDDFSFATSCAEIAADSQPGWYVPVLLQAKIIIVKVAKQMLLQDSESELRNATDFATQALRIAHERRDPAAQAESLLLRAACYEFRHLKPKALPDIEAAFALMPDEVAVKLAYTEILERRGERDTAVNLLRPLASEPGPAMYRLAELLAKSVEREDQLESIDLFHSVAVKHNRVRSEEAAERALEIACSLKEYGKVSQLLLEFEQYFSHVTVNCFKAAVEIYQCNSDSACGFVEDAKKALGLGDSSDQEKYSVAALLHRLKKFKEALPLYRQVVSPRSYSNLLSAYLQCAMLANADDEALSFCTLARENGITNRELVLAESTCLAKYDFDGALSLLSRFVHDRPEEKVARLHLSVLALEKLRWKFVCKEPSLLPRASELPPDGVRALVHVLKFGGDPDLALQIGYECYRHNLMSKEANMAFAINLQSVRFPPNLVKEFAEVQLGCAVTYSEYEDTRTVVIEDSSDAIPSLCEITAEHPLARALLGRKVGDQFLIARGNIKDRIGKIESIQSKYVYRYQVCMEEFQTKFPDGDFESVKLGETEDGPDITPILETAKRRHDAVMGLVDAYTTKPMSLHFLGQAVGRDVMDTVQFLAHSTDKYINCCAGVEQEREQTRAAANGQTSFVLDASAIATLSLLGRLDLLTRWKGQLLVPQALITALEEKLFLEWVSSPATSGFLISDGDSHVLHERSAEEKLARTKELEDLIAILRSLDVRSGREVAKIENSRREFLTKIFGRHGLEAMVIARDTRLPLWTDDQVVGVVAGSEFQVSRIWTQWGIDCAIKMQLITLDEGFRLAASLIGYGYRFTYPSVQSLLAAADLANWDTGKRPLREHLKMLEASAIDTKSVLELLIGLLIRVSQERPTSIVPFTLAARQILSNHIYSAELIRRSIYELDQDSAASKTKQKLLKVLRSLA